jgi:chorismate mutase-like protein
MSIPRDFLPAGTGYRRGECANSGRAQADAVPRALLSSIGVCLLFLSSCTRYEPAPLSSCGGRITQVKLDPADVPVAPRRDLAALDCLLRLMEQRLALMHEVARWKWDADKPITDAERERELLRTVVERGRVKGLDPELVRSFFAAQMEAARLVQQVHFDRWKAKKQRTFADTTSLAVLRQRIDDLNRELIDALAELRHWLSEPAVQRELPRRAEKILTGSDLGGVCETAVAPLRR